MSVVNQLEKYTATPKTKIYYQDPQIINKFSWDLTYRLLKLGFNYERPLVVICIGTDRSTGDCLGPLVGSKLNEVEQDFYHVYGTLEDPVHARNLEEKLELIMKTHKDAIIIAIDACLGQLESVGYINIATGALKPGAGVQKSLPSFGDIHITGIVNVGGFMEYLVLQNTRLSLVMKLADLIKDGLLATISEFKQTKEAISQQAK